MTTVNIHNEINSLYDFMASYVEQIEHTGRLNGKDNSYMLEAMTCRQYRFLLSKRVSRIAIGVQSLYTHMPDAAKSFLSDLAPIESVLNAMHCYTATRGRKQRKNAASNAVAIINNFKKSKHERAHKAIPNECGELGRHA